MERNCIECRYYIPSAKTFYNKPTGFCGNIRVNMRRRGLSEACAYFEQYTKSQYRARRIDK